ncbi:prolyl oligopeptidase family serine peptidase [Alterisphingorhabdus coralli]|uniref:prolyl oligopeptidase n=1 Tax=Alterisphingorhabdus coralli TaxID=3071408 RepID=A0AA97F988_9SPHN|nr:prolyl oligopeptidase family serine peptidase [Parasphingorhabdus sp. SCSIO 66989]WOE76246.1 prolyl oligopeptidase family serine peptidase [Parasphingorhabdus sp. SCSIO 66989]
MRSKRLVAPLLCAATAIATLPVIAVAGEVSDAAEDAAVSAPSGQLSYPETRTVDIVDTQFGVDVADPYRWLENDVREDKAVAEWVEQQNAVTNTYLNDLPGREALAKKMTAFYNYERFGLPKARGDRYFYSRNDGLQNQSVLYVRDGLEGQGRVLIDPNGWSDDGATALAGWEASADGSKLVYAIQDGGSDWRTLKVVDVASGKVLDDEIKWVKFSSLSWVGNDAFLYSRFPEPEEGAEFQSLNTNQAVYYHKIGTPQLEDRLVYATPDAPKTGHSATVTDDNHWVVITSSVGTDERYEITVIPIGKGDWTPMTLVSGFDNEWDLIDSVDGQLYFVTNKDAPRLRVVRFDMADMAEEPTEIIPETEATLSNASIVGNKMIVSYLEDAKSLAKMYRLDGTEAGVIDLANIGTVRGFGGKPGNPETFYRFSSFSQPGAVYRLDTNTGESTVFATPELAFDPTNYTTRQVFYSSEDGTDVPMFIVHRKDLDLSKGAPTLLYGYGGFNISLTPGFSPTRMAWMEAGGVFAMANLRGGGEYGKVWHDGGRLLNKRNVFDDFIAAGEYLIAEGITGKDQLAVEGRSNGGLLVGAVVNQRPDLFAAGHAAVGVMDMLRFDRFTAGRYWVDDYGYPNREADFRNLLSYSPYHNIRSGAEYPAVIVSTADTDDRVVPGHSFKYTAALQAADTGLAPKIIRIETRAGHGSGKPTEKIIEEYSDIYAFLAHHTGLAVE